MDKPRKLVWSPRAEDDLIAIWVYLAEEASDEIATQHLRKINELCLSLLDRPFKGRTRSELRPGLRSVLAAPHVVFYNVAVEKIEIVRVLHERRDLDAIFRRT